MTNQQINANTFFKKLTKNSVAIYFREYRVYRINSEEWLNKQKQQEKYNKNRY